MPKSYSILISSHTRIWSASPFGIAFDRCTTIDTQGRELYIHEQGVGLGAAKQEEGRAGSVETGEKDEHAFGRSMPIA